MQLGRSKQLATWNGKQITITCVIPGNNLKVLVPQTYNNLATKMAQDGSILVGL